VISVALLWEAWKASQQSAPPWRILIYLLAAAAGISLGIAGTHEKAP